MATKRSRAAYEDDQRSQPAPYVFYGTPLPPQDSKTRDDGSYVPLWKQEVTDERGRKRLHGAFTGGFSAGYFNTVGSKEGWSPATFVSSRNKRQASSAQKPEDFMDEEDVREAEEGRMVATSGEFSGLGGTEEEAAAKATVMDLLRPSGESAGVKLLRRMGWRDGQGIGPKVRRRARDDGGGEDDAGSATHLFAPEDVPVVTLARKNDRKGLGFAGQAKLGSAPSKTNSDDEADGLFRSVIPKDKKVPSARGGIGGGILNDTGSDEDDPYAIGPKLSYNRVIGGDKRKKNKKTLESGGSTSANPLLKNKPVFVSKRKGKTAGGTSNSKRCHDGRLPLSGFVLAIRIPSSGSHYPPPDVPADWQPAAGSAPTTTDANGAAPGPAPREQHQQSTTELAKASMHDPSSRGKLLGETPLAGKSVFAYLTPSAREKIAGLTSKSSLPAAGSERLAHAGGDADGGGGGGGDDGSAAADLIPPLSPRLALSALGRGTKGFVPYVEDPAKHARYRGFLGYRGGVSDAMPTWDRTVHASREEWARELAEFAHAAAIFKPMAGGMAARFAAASSGSGSGTRGTADDKGAADDEGTSSTTAAAHELPNDAQAAARMSMFGPLTRSQAHFYPTRLLCKRFNVPPPAHAGADGDAHTTSASASASFSSMTPSTAMTPAAGAFVPRAVDAGTGAAAAAGMGPGLGLGKSKFASGGFQLDENSDPVASSTVPESTARATNANNKALLNDARMTALLRDAGYAEAADQWHVQANEQVSGGGDGNEAGGIGNGTTRSNAVDPERNAALEQERPGAALFRAVFGDSDDDDEDEG